MAKKVKQNIWKNRIVGYGEKPAKDFVFNPLNWRTHPEFQRRAIDGILSEVGWVTGVIENQISGFVIDGHARIEQALIRGENELIPFIKVELSIEEEKKILAVLDPIGALAGTDEDKLRELSSILNFESGALDELMADKFAAQIDLNDFFETKEDQIISEKFSIEIEFSNREEFRLVSSRLNEIAATPLEAVRRLLDL